MYVFSFSELCPMWQKLYSEAIREYYYTVFTGLLLANSVMMSTLSS